MSEQGDLDILTGGSVSEGKEMSDEQFREQMAQTQAALKQLQQEERRAKQNDQGLAGILVQFLGQPQNTDLFLLISRVVAQNVPSELILAVISLIDPRAEQEVRTYLAAAPGGAGAADKALVLVQHHNSFQTLGPEQKKRLELWFRHLQEVAGRKPHRTLESILLRTRDENGDVTRMISDTLVQLSAFILRRYLAGFKISLEFQSLFEFIQEAWLTLVKDLEEQVKGQRQLAA